MSFILSLSLQSSRSRPLAFRPVQIFYALSLIRLVLLNAADAIPDLKAIAEGHFTACHDLKCAATSVDNFVY